ncbi:MAG: ATPase and DNA damage recognition protein of nucleotide excision repair excinuclease UvrABC [Candidatus Thorarchaeota archaeon]|nr:MAG: ATPase and DNA damage recognition protein of nucleotide excision repair excinuclease UvrABC [Candidatus Thorarchaeota archaeon]
MTGFISVRKAEEHNLKAIDVDIPRDRLVVVTGPSGSGKSTLVFDTIFAEGQRRYVESLSSYARRFLGRLDKPKVQSITGLPPAISIEQKGRSKNPRSTVSTSTEIQDYLRLLYANIGIPHCVECGRAMEQLTPESAAKVLLEDNGGERILILAPVVRDEPGTHEDVLQSLLENGFVRVRIDGEVIDIDSVEIDGRKKHDIDVVVDRLELSHKYRERLTGSIETALETGDGSAIVSREGKEDLTFAERLMCPYCGVQYEKLNPKMFSYNRPDGACPQCNGLGITMDVDPDLVIPKESMTVHEIAKRAFENRRYLMRRIDSLADIVGFSKEAPLSALSEKHRRMLLWGDPPIDITYGREKEDGTSWEVTRAWLGIIPWLKRVFAEGNSSDKSWYRRRAQNIADNFTRQTTCSDCDGRKLRPESLAVTVGNMSIDKVTSLTIEEALKFFESIELSEREMKIANLILKEIKARLKFLMAVGLEYLNLDRLSRTLSGGESQRIRLATQIGSALTGVLYCLDEPSIGLHPRDINRLIETFYNLRSLGNTVVVIEHDRDTISAADHIIDLGPLAGRHGGEIVASGSPKEVLTHPKSLTAQYLAGEKQIPVPEKRRKGNGKVLRVRNARQNNLKGIDVEFPLGTLICCSGVSGSGKSTLVYETLYKTLAREINNASTTPGTHDSIEGVEHIERLVLVDQSSIGRTPRSNPATYTKTFDHIRSLFAKMPEAKKRGYTPSRFSFNTRSGRCSKCRGSGVIRVEMHFMSDVFMTCDACKGKRFDRETLEVEYKGMNISQVLHMTIDEALEFFSDIPKIADRLQTLVDVGLGYLQLGQPATQLSGGEAQRMKLASELWRRNLEPTLYILDEPTTGLSASDIHTLLRVLNRFVDAGHSIIIIEHNLDVLKVADHLIDLGPEGGIGGGTVIATGTPEELSEVVESYTGNHLRAVLYGPEVVYGPLS